MQERSHAFAMKSQIWLRDPWPNLPSIVHAVEKSFELSEASNTPVMLQMRIRACHVHGRFIAKENVRPSFTLKDAIGRPVRNVSRIVLPPASFLHEEEKIQRRLHGKDMLPKVIIAQSECMLNRQRRVKPLVRKLASEGKRVVRERFGVDSDTCTGDRSCIRLSGCPSLTVADNSDPLRREPVAADKLPATGAMLLTPPLKIVGGSGSPCRVLALVER